MLCSSSGAPPAAVHETACTWRIACLCDGRRDTKKERGGRGPGPPATRASDTPCRPACPLLAVLGGIGSMQNNCNAGTALQATEVRASACMRHAAWLAGWLCTRLCYVVSWCRCVFCPCLLASPRVGPTALQHCSSLCVTSPRVGPTALQDAPHSCHAALSLPW